METEKKEWTKAFTVFKKFKDAVYADPANKAEGTHTVKDKDGNEKELPNLNYSVYNFQNKEKDGKADGATFTMGKNGGEAIKFVLAESGTLRGAEYIDWTGVEKGGLPKEKEWVGKDFDKLSGLIKDATLKELAGKMDWTKAADREQDNDKDIDDRA